MSATETDAGCRRWERDAEYTLCGNIRVDDAYLDGELAGGKAGRDSQSEVPFVAAISLGTKAVPCMIKMALIFGFTRKTVFDWTTADLASGCIVTSDGLSCFAGITDAGCQHRAIVADGLKNFSSQKK
nr:transposase [Nitrosomonas mobilis]